MAKPMPFLPVLKLIFTWCVSLVIADGILLLLGIAVLAITAIGKWSESCPFVSLPTLETAWPLARTELARMGSEYHLSADRFVLKEVLDPKQAQTPFWRNDWIFVYQVRGDIERPRRVNIFVDRCRRTNYGTEPYADWSENNDG